MARRDEASSAVRRPPTGIRRRNVTPNGRTGYPNLTMSGGSRSRRKLFLDQSEPVHSEGRRGFLERFAKIYGDAG
jgi:hypothetical protein